MFDYINLENSPNAILDQYGCSSNFLSISPENNPLDSYKLCQQRRGVKLITTYSNVLINFVTNALTDINSGFSIIFRIIKDPSDRKNKKKLF